jgi:hypothetical protein
MLKDIFVYGTSSAWTYRTSTDTSFGQEVAEVAELSQRTKINFKSNFRQPST